MAKKAKGESSIVWNGTESVLRLANVVGIPVVGGGPSVVRETLDTFEAACADHEDIREILALLADHGDSIWEIVQVMSVDYLRDSKDIEAQVARSAIQQMGFAIDTAYGLALIFTRYSTLERVWHRNNIKAQMKACEETLERTTSRFNASMQNLSIAQSVGRKTTDGRGSKDETLQEAEHSTVAEAGHSTIADAVHSTVADAAPLVVSNPKIDDE